MKYAFTFLLFFSATASLSNNANAQFCEGKYYTYSQNGIPLPTVDYQGVRYRISAKSSQAGMRTMVEGNVSEFKAVTVTLEKPILAVQLDEQGMPLC